ncbi:MAG TPA: hypothetical protein VIN40_02115 [Candidatus Tyrphobacter sp.]
MSKPVLRATAAALLAASFLMPSLPAMADGTVDAISQNVVTGANTAIRNAMNAAARRRAQRVSPATVGQVPPVQQPATSAQQGLPLGFTYTLDVSLAYPFGDIGTYGKRWLPGGMDGVLGYGFTPTSRLVASYYEIQHWPVGFNSGTVPLYLQGFATPIGSANLGTTQPQLDPATKDRFFLANFENLFVLGDIAGNAIPLVITPSYVARWSKIAQSPTNNDVLPFEPTPGTSVPYYGVHWRTAQYYSVAFTVPFLKTPKFFGTFTIAPTWLVHTAGINGPNTAQLYQILYLEYTPTPTTTIFIEPQSSRDYLPLDPYPQHIIDYFAGISQRISRYGFIQLVLNSGGPTNQGPYGIRALTCQQLPCAPNQIVPTVGGLKATQLQLQIGIGSPSVIQF